LLLSLLSSLFRNHHSLTESRGETTTTARRTAKENGRSRHPFCLCLSLSLSLGKKFSSFFCVGESLCVDSPLLGSKKIETLNPTTEKSSYDVTRRNETRRFDTNFSLSKSRTRFIYTHRLLLLISRLFLLSPFSLRDRERQRERQRETERRCFFQRRRGKDGSERLISHLLLHLLLFRLAGSFFFRMSLRRRPRNLLLFLLLLRAFEDFKAAARVVVVEEDGIARR